MKQTYSAIHHLFVSRPADRALWVLKFLLWLRSSITKTEKVYNYLIAFLSVVHRQEIFRMAEVQYGRIIENGIANTPKNTLNFTQIYNLVRDQSCPTVSKTTIRRWLRRLEEEEIINREGGHRMRNQVYYSLTDARIFEREFFGSESKSKQNVELTSYIEEGQQEADKKVCILILLQAALDTVLPKFTNEPELGGVYCYNPATGRNECLVGEKLDGVTMKEVLDHRNIGLGGLFDHVNFTQLLRKNNYIEIIQEELGLKNNTIRMTFRKDENGIGIKINDGPLNDYINICACMTS